MNYGTHTHPTVKAWLAKHPRVHLHFTTTSASWMNLVEVFFAIITRQAIRRGSFASVPDLVAAIGRFVDGWNQRSHPFMGSKTPTTTWSKRPVNEPQGQNTSIGLAVPGRPIGLWSRRTGAPKASATRRDRTPVGPCWVRIRRANYGQRRA